MMLGLQYDDVSWLFDTGLVSLEYLSDARRLSWQLSRNWAQLADAFASVLRVSQRVHRHKPFDTSFDLHLKCFVDPFSQFQQG